MGGVAALLPLDWFSLPQNFACCFALSFLASAAGALLIAQVPEPPAARPPLRPLARAYLRQLIAAIRRHPLFVHFLWARPALGRWSGPFSPSTQSTLRIAWTQERRRWPFWDRPSSLERR